MIEGLTVDLLEVDEDDSLSDFFSELLLLLFEVLLQDAFTNVWSDKRYVGKQGETVGVNLLILTLTEYMSNGSLVL